MLLRLLLTIVMYFTLVGGVFASVEIARLLPDTTNDPTDEWIEIRNTGCERTTLDGYSITDLSGKKYNFSSGSSLDSHTTMRLSYDQTRIHLDNTDESLIFTDSGWVEIDRFSYTKSEKWVEIVNVELSVDTVCPSSGSGETSLTPTPSPTGEGSQTGSWWESSTGGQIPPNPPSQDGSQTGSQNNSSTGGIQTPLPPLTGGWDTGSQTNTNSWYTESGVLTPISLYYSDSDVDKKIDTLEIVYPFLLTGSVNTGAILLFSASWGLDSSPISTQSGWIVSGSLSWNILILRLREWDLEKIILKINNTTSSELRLKSSWDLGLTSLLRKTPDHFTLTSSFDSYRSVFSGSMAENESRKKNTESGGVQIPTNPPSQGGFQTGSQNPPSPPTPLPEGEGSQTGVIFPSIIPTIQSPTNASFSGGIFLCDRVSLCRINLDFESIFSGGILSRDFSCRIESGTGVLTTCNPATLYFSSSGSIRVEILHKSSWQSRDQIFPIEWREKIPISSVSTSAPPPSTNRPPILILELDAQLRSYMEMPEQGKIDCYSLTCAVNLTAERSHDPDGGDIRFLWIYDFVAVKTSRDPWAYSFIGTGSHTMIVRVIDSHGAYTEERYTIRVLGPRPRAEKELWEKTKKPPKESISEEGIPENILEVLLQNPGEEVSRDEDIFLCQIGGKKKTCSLNFTLSGTTKGYQYEWRFPEREWPFDSVTVSQDASTGALQSYFSRNPRSYSFPLGASEVILIISDTTWVEIERRVLRVRVEKTGLVLPCEGKWEGFCLKKWYTQKKKQLMKKQAVMFYNPPTIVLQKSKADIQIFSTQYVCRTTGKQCSINLTLSGALKWYTYEWMAPRARNKNLPTVYISKNPKSLSFPLGRSRITLRVRASNGEILSEMSREVIVEKKIKPKKQKKPKKLKKKKVSTPKPKKIILSEDQTETESGSDRSILIWILSLILLSGGVITVWVLRRSRNKT